MPIDPQTLPGALALIKMDEGSGRVAKNAWGAVVNPGDNIAPAPEQYFADNIFWFKNLVTATDFYANDSNGVLKATRLQFAAGVAYMESSAINNPPPAGQFTVSAKVKRTGGTDQTFRIGLNQQPGSPQYTNYFTATGSWQVFSQTLTLTNPPTVIVLLNDLSTASDILVEWIAVVPGATPAVYTEPQYDIIVGDTNSHTWSATGLTASDGNKRSIVLTPDLPTFTAVTVHAVVKQGDVTAIAKVLRDRADLFSGPNLGEAAGVGGVPGATAGGGFSAVVDGDYCERKGSIDDGRWHLVTCTFDGATIAYYLDGVLLFSSASTKSWASTGFWLGKDVSGGLGFIGDYAMLAIYTQGHTAAEVLQFYQYAASEVSGRGITLEGPRDFIVIEGDSISEWKGMYPHPAMDGLGVSWISLARSGSYVDPDNGALEPRMADRAADVDRLAALGPDHRGLFVYIGTNDYISGGETGATFVAKLKSYCTDRMAKWRIGVATTPSITHPDDTTTNAKRNAGNALIVADTSFYDARCNLHLNSAIGPDLAANDTLLFVDKIHPTLAASTDEFAPEARATIQELLALDPPAGSIDAITSPTSSDRRLTGVSETITWTYTGAVDNVDILLSTDGGSTYSVTIVSNEPNDGNYSYTPTTDHITATAKVKVRSSADALVFAESAAFKIATTTGGGGRRRTLRVIQ